MGKGYVDLTPEQRAAEAESAKLLKSPRRQADQERMRLIGEKLGLARFADDRKKLREGETAAAMPQEPTPRRRKPRKPGGGNKPKLPDKTITDGTATYNSMLKGDPTWAENKTASAKRVIELLKLDVSVSTVKRRIVDPVLKEREQNKQR
jgi:hypothetical protein